MYGSMKESKAMEKEDNDNLPLVVKEQADSRKIAGEFESFDADFWNEVHQRYEEKIAKEKAAKEKEAESEKYGKLNHSKRFWSQSLDEIRAEKIRKKFELQEQDPIVAILHVWLRNYVVSHDAELIPSFKNQIAKLVSILLDQECEKQNCASFKSHHCKYASTLKMYIYKEKDGTEKTLLHLVAEEDLVILAKEVIKRFPGMLYVETFGDQVEPSRLPVEIALLKYHDTVAAEMIKNMQNERVRKIFEFHGSTETLKFKDYIQRADMQQTVIAVLDSMVNPDWPCVPLEENKETNEEPWSNVPDIPIRYHFYYRILDGDDHGRPARQDFHGYSKTNRDFDYKADSCLKHIVRSPHKDIVIRHPVVRMLGDRKWNEFGKIRIRFFAVVYCFFLAALSIALLSSVSAKDPRKYDDGMDYTRMVCEIITLTAAGVFLLLEIVQMTREKRRYIYDFYNFLDLFGIVSLYCLIPLRFSNNPSQWSLAAVSYFVNFLRILKFSPAWEFIGLYSKCLIQMLKKDVSKFFIVYMNVVLAFGGSLFLALKATGKPNSVGNFGHVVLREIRILVDSQAFVESYSQFHVIIVLLILVNMLIALILLVNMLIAQLSSSYEDAAKDSGLLYDIDKTLMVAKLEQLPFANLRVKYYSDGSYENDMTKVRGYFNDWENLKKERNIGNLPGKDELDKLRKRASNDDFLGVIL